MLLTLLILHMQMHSWPHLSTLRRNVRRSERRMMKRRACVFTLRMWSIPADDLVDLDQCGGWKRSLKIEMNKDALFGSMETCVKGDHHSPHKNKQTKKPQNRCLENDDERTCSCCHDAALHSYACMCAHCWNGPADLRQVQQWLDFLSMTTKKQKTYTPTKRTRLL